MIQGYSKEYVDGFEAEIDRLENAMRDIQAVTSDKAVLAITDMALCPPAQTRRDPDELGDRLIKESLGEPKITPFPADSRLNETICS